MKKQNIYLITMMMMAMSMLQSCNDDGYSLGDFVVRMATVHVENGNMYLQTDNGQKLWPGATAIPWYKPVDGQRVWADYTILSDEISGTEYAHAIKVNYLYNVLTKTVDELTADNEESIGNDPAYIEEMWIGGNCLNVQFVIQRPVNEPHRVSLVENTLDDTPIVDEDGYICLEYRFNEADDVYNNTLRRSFVSFHLGEYGPLQSADKTIKGLKLKINSIKNGEKVVTLDYATSINADKQTKIGEDVVNEGTY